MQNNNIVIIDNGLNPIHVHAEGCSHVSQSVRVLSRQGLVADTTGRSSVEQAMVDYFGEVAADDYEWGTDEWEERVALEWRLGAVVHLCAEGLS